MTHITLTRTAVLALCAVLAACGGGDGPVNPPPTQPTVASVTVTTPAATLVAGTTAQLTAAPLTSSGQAVAGKTAAWQSGSAAVATVSPTGMVTAVAPGTVRITATVDGIVGGVDLTVRAAVASVQVTPSPAEVAPGASRQLSVAALDAAGAPVLGYPQPVWSSADSSIATVSSAGVVTGVAGGTVEIRATVEGRQGAATVRVAVPVPSGLRFSTLTAGSLHACALDTGGSAWCWGLNQSGQLGGVSTDACTRSRDAGVTLACSRYPVPVSGGLRFTAISAGTDGGGEATCAISTAGRPWCWGGGAYGQIGNGQKQNASTPMAVNVPAGKTFTQVASGERFACALVSDGTAWCWGDNFYGTLGSGSPFSDATATPVEVATTERFTSLTAGALTACGLTAAGKAFCWGMVGAGRQERAPAAMAPSLTFEQIVAGGSISNDVHLCGRQADGKVFCWGDNTGGQMGIPTGTGTTYPNPVPAMGGHSYTAITAGAGYTCGIEAGGAVRCAGRNTQGELGIGRLGRVAEPTVVEGPPFRALTTGWFSCGLTTDGIAFCWGRNEYGGLGTNEGETCQASPNFPVIPCSMRPIRVRGQD